ncbi:hypothetical protein FHR51_003251 [Xanthomonas arboricola]|nr:hypothetical protein [Xanthomonas cannabis]
MGNGNRWSGSLPPGAEAAWGVQTQSLARLCQPLLRAAFPSHPTYHLSQLLLSLLLLLLAFALAIPNSRFPIPDSRPQNDHPADR